LPTYFGLWKFNTTLPPPPDPKFSVRQSEGFGTLLRQQMQSGIIKEAYSFLEGNMGYFVTGDVSEEKLHEALLSYSPYVTFEIHRTVPLTRSIETLIEVQRKQAASFTAITA
jgi:hypothetical protein